jgi:hypothetical protein
MQATFDQWKAKKTPTIVSPYNRPCPEGYPKEVNSHDYKTERSGKQSKVYMYFPVTKTGLIGLGVLNKWSVGGPEVYPPGVKPVETATKVYGWIEFTADYTEKCEGKCGDCVK